MRCGGFWVLCCGGGLSGGLVDLLFPGLLWWLRYGWFWCFGVRPVLGSLVWVYLVSLGVVDFALFGGAMVLAGWVCCNTGSADLPMFGGFCWFRWGVVAVVVGFWCCVGVVLLDFSGFAAIGFL